MSSRFYYLLGVAGYFALFILLMLWTTWLAPPTIMPVAVVLVLYVGPLLFPLKGILNARPYTFAWTQFMALFYFAIGVMVAVSNPAERVLGGLQIIFSLMLFVGAMLFIRTRAKEVKPTQQHEDAEHAK
ncbi:MAG: DUF2069 domain-containing protein [Granulosicoccaceae bacterium]|jgi:uncharacterized membrane protein